MPTLSYIITADDSGFTTITMDGTGLTGAAILDCEARQPLAFVTPATWLACNVTFQTLPFADGLTVSGTPSQIAISDLATLYDDTNTGTALTMATQAGKGQYTLFPTIFATVRYINITSSVGQTVGSKVMFALQPLFEGIHA